jgi:hypothetical protein
MVARRIVLNDGCQSCVHFGMRGNTFGCTKGGRVAAGEFYCVKWVAAPMLDKMMKSDRAVRK